MKVTIRFVALVIAAIAVTSAAPCAAATTLPMLIEGRTLQEFALPAIEFVPGAIAIDAAGDVWVAQTGGYKLVELCANGRFRRFTVPTPRSQIQEMTAADDGTLWFTETQTFDGSQNFIGHIARDGTITTYAVPRSDAFLMAISPAPGGGVWAGEFGANRVARVTRGGSVSEYRAPGPSDEYVRSLVTDADGSLWIAENHAIMHLLRNGRVEQYPIASPQPGDGIRNMIRAGAHSFWLTLYSQPGEQPSIWHFAPTEGLTRFTVPSSSLGTSLLVPDRAGGAWFPVIDGNAIDHIDATGMIVEYPTPLRGSDIMGMALTRSGDLVFTNMQSEKIGFFGHGMPSPLPVMPVLPQSERAIIVSWRRQLQPRESFAMGDVTADTVRVSGRFAVVGWSDLNGNAASLLRNDGSMWRIVATTNGNFYQQNDLTDHGVPLAIAMQLLDDANVQLVPKADQ